MRLRGRVSRCALLAVLLLAPAEAWSGFAHQAAAESAQAVAPQPAPLNPRALYQALNGLQPDPSRVYSIHELNLRRDAISLKLAEGKLAFFQPLDGRVTGAVFAGRGHILATPRDRGERRSLAEFLGVPLLDQPFSRAYFRFTDSTAAEIEGQLKAESDAPDSDIAFAESWAPAVARLNPSHSLRILFDWLSQDPQPYFYAGIGSEAVGAFDVMVDPRRDDQVLIGQPRIVHDSPLYNVWASFPAANTASPPAPAFTPLDYRVDTTIGADLALEGRTALHLKAQRAGERIVPLELSHNLAIEEARLENSEPLEFFQNEELGRRDILRRGNDSVAVVLPAQSRAGEEFRLEVKYRGSVISDAGNGVEFVGERSAWYAHLGGTDHFTPFDLRFRWPKRFTLVATGEKVESHDEGEVKTGRWVSNAPFAVAGFNLGEYKMETATTAPVKVQLYANRQLEDAIVARLRENALVPPPADALPSLSGLPTDLAPSPEPLPSPAHLLRQLGGQIADSIQFFENVNGPFPFDHLDVSQIPGSFGQGWPGLVYLSTLAFLPPEAQAQVGLAEKGQEETRELMPFHEVAHQWWGNVVVSATYRDAWIEEAMAQYLALLYNDSKKPGERRLETWLRRFRQQLVTPLPGSATSSEQAGPISLGLRLASSKTPEAYDAVIYGKGTWVIHMLREMLRDSGSKDPDARFRELLRSVLAEYRFRALSTDDFERAIEQRMTPAMDLEGTHRMNWFFEQWVKDTGIPRYRVEFQVKPRGQDFLVTGKLLQRDVGDIFTASVPLYTARTGGKPERLGNVVTSGPETRFHFVTRVRPTKILIDPHLTLLCRTD